MEDIDQPCEENADFLSNQIETWGRLVTALINFSKFPYPENRYATRRRSRNVTRGLVSSRSMLHGTSVAQVQAAWSSRRSSKLLARPGRTGSRVGFSRRMCLDWTERRPHIAGAVGAALTKRYFDLGWTERMNHQRVGKTRLPGNLQDRRSRCKGCSRIARAI